MIRFSPEALRSANVSQLSEVLYQHGPNVDNIDVFRGDAASLPSSHLSVIIHYYSRGSITGGIDPDGKLST